MESNSTAFLIKIKLRHSLGRPSRSDFVQREVAKIQDEFLRVFRTKDLQQLARFHRQLDIIAEGYRAQSVSF